MRIGSLFSGIGGLELGLERAGVGHTIWQCEIEHYPRTVLARHWPNARRFTDIRLMGRDEEVPYVEVICGGFPCQDLSYAGSRAGLGGARSGLFWELMRIVRLVGPRYIVLENVPGLLTADQGGAMGSVLGALAEGGYDAEWDCIPASAVGAKHRRDRVYILAYTEQNGRFDDAIGSDDSRMAETVTTPRSDRPTQAVQSGYRGALRMWRGECDATSQKWLATPEPERLTLTGVGDLADGVPGWVAESLAALGNAVVPQVAEVVGRRLMQLETARAIQRTQVNVDARQSL